MMSDDDGLMLNFAAAPTRTPTKRLNGQRRYERQQRNAVRDTVNETKRSSVTPPVTLPPVTNTASKRKEEDINQAKSMGRGPLPSISSAALANSTPYTQGRPVPAPPGRNGYISSLFTGDEASTSRKPVRAEPTDEAQHLPTNAPSSGTPFGSLGLDPLLVHHLQAPKMGIKIPTSIQRNALPFLLSPTNSGRDALIHAQTGSGKTFSYILPIIQSLLPLCETSWIDRQCLGTLAIILAPTRELAHQIYEVAEKLCSLHLTSQGAAKPDHTREDEGEEDEGADDAVEEDRGTRRTRWIIPGLLSGGATRNHEKSRLRKGLPLIVATPGRLLDHLRNTGSLDVGRLQWLVLDEADRLLQLGFEQTLTDIMKAIDGRRRSTCEAQRMRMVQELGTQTPQDQSRIPDEEVVDSFGEMWWKTSRRTILCSATLDEGVQVLAGKSLINPRVIRADGEDISSEGPKVGEEKVGAGQAQPEKMTMLAAPAQLRQKYAVVPTKQRLIVLVALLRQAVAAGRSKIMVFLSCTDSVDFHWAALGGVRMAQGGEEAQTDSDGRGSDALRKESELLPSTSVFKLHGSLSQRDRQTSLKLFSQCTGSAVLLCTSVASRGLDLDVSLVVQLDPPSEKGVDEYLHRIGRTARVGEDGESWIMLLPSEKGCIPFYEGQMGATARKIEERQANDIITTGFTSSRDLWQAQGRATEVQLAFERWVLQTDDHAGLARKAYLSHLRAYTTHPPSERQYFSINNLQLGHLAKAFALREAPGEIRAKVKASNEKSAAKSAAQVVGTEQPGNKQKRKRSGGVDGLEGQGDGEVNDDDDDDDEEEDIAKKSLDFARNKETEAKMYAKVRQMGKLNRRGGVLGSYGIDEYQIG